MDITQLILDDHHEQRRLFAILEQVDRGNTDALRAVWGRLAAFLELHAAAEEKIFYPELLRVGTMARRTSAVEDETLDAIHDHNEIRDAVTAVAEHAVGSDEWYAAVAAANLANSDHMAEEEREGLTDFRRLASLQRRHDLGVSLGRLRGPARHRGPAGGQGPGGIRPGRGGDRAPAGGTPRPGRLPEHRQPQEQLTSPRTRAGPGYRRPPRCACACG